MYTCGELTHSPSDGDLRGHAGPWPASMSQKREAARDGRFLIPVIRDDCSPV